MISEAKRMNAQQAALAQLLSLTKLSRAIAVVLVTTYLVGLVAPSTKQYIALVPGRFIPCVWNIVTAGILELYLYKLVFSVASILLLAKLIEPVWGSKEFVTFIAATNAATGACTLVLLYIIFTLTQYSEKSGDLLYKEIAGFEGVVAACLVAVKQIMPDNEVVLLGFIRFRAKHLPSIFLLLAVCGSFLLGTSLSTVPFVCFGTYGAWVYLRFLQYNSELSVRGDRFNEEFRFASFFPEVMQPPVDRVAEVVGKALRLDKGSAPVQGAKHYVPGAAPLPGSDDADAARRRERGARALEERLGARKSIAAAAPVPADIEAPAAVASRAEPLAAGAQAT